MNILFDRVRDQFDKGLLGVRFGLYRHRTGTSVPEGKTDLNSAKTDIAA